MNIFYRKLDLITAIRCGSASKSSIGFVPTMGGLHLGHKSLVKFASNKCDRVIVSIFINPTQFTEEEDFEIYPQTQDADCVLIKEAGGNAVFIPDISEMYPKGFSTKVSVSGLTNIMCGASRPGHFDGVTQVVTKLLNQASANNVYFGEKDWQQLAIIKRLVSDLDIPTNIVSGLALSSRNNRISLSSIEIASNIFKNLNFVKSNFNKLSIENKGKSYS